MESVLRNIETEDIAVFSRDMLDDEYAVNFDKPFLTEEPNGKITEFDTEDAACAFQREWRVSNGLDPLTGSPVDPRPARAIGRLELAKEHLTN